MKVEVTAPMSGIFYRKPAPDEEPYVGFGDSVDKRQVLGLLETMKVFQKIKAPVAGKIAGIAVDNEATVSDGDLLFVIETH
jgi:biotin carboxyl carrier protein